MSISKPTLTNPWASSGSTNIVNPGGVNETGFPAAGKGPPRRWFNWVMNKVDTAIRYLVGRGLSDFDPNESYSIGDRVQYGGAQGLTFVCVTATVGDGSGGNSPIASPALWARWARGIPDYSAGMNYQLNDIVIASNGSTYLCIQANSVSSAREPSASPTYWQRWGHRDSDVVTLIQANPEIVTAYSGTTLSGITLSTGNISNVIDMTLGNDPAIRDLSFTLSNIPLVPGYIDVSLSGARAFASAIKNIQVTSETSPTTGIPVYGEITGSNSVRVHASRSTGATATACVRLLGY